MFLLLVIIFNILLASVAAVSKPASGPIVLPTDDGFLENEQVQWWYYTGHLKTPDNNKTFGFEVCWFLVTSVDQLVQVRAAFCCNASFSYACTHHPSLLLYAFHILLLLNILISSPSIPFIFPTIPCAE